MSRRGGGGMRGKRLPGAEFSWQSEPGAEADTAPTPLFPKYRVPRAQPLSKLELSQVDHYRKLREMIHEGPFYAVLGQAPSYGKGGQPVRARFDPFQGMATYGQRYIKKSRTLPKLSAIPFEMNLFPKDIWSTLDPKYVGLPSGTANGLGLPSRAGQKRGFEDEEEEMAVDTSRKRRAVGEEEDASDVERRRDSDDEIGMDDEGDGEEEIIDDDFEDDEEDMGGDYNAEQYFDGGDEGDDYGDMDGGDGDVY